MAGVYDIDYTPTKLVLINERARPKVSYSPSDGATIAVASIMLYNLERLRSRHDLIRGFTHTW